MKKISFLILAMCMSLAIVLAVEPTSAWFGAVPPANSAEDADKLAEGHFEKAIELLKQENYQEAIVEYEKVIKLLPKSKIAQDAQYWIGQSYFRMGQLDEALSIFEKLIEDYPGSAIAPVTQLMMARVQQEKENKKLRAKSDATSDKKVIIDPKTGVKYTKTKTFTGKKDVIEYVPSHICLSPNGKFLLYHKLVIPLKGEEPFDLVDMPAECGIWSPDGKKVAFYSEGGIWVIPVSPETGRPTGPSKKLIDGNHWYQSPVSWSPDSERIVFKRGDKETQSDIWTLSVKDGTLTQITDDHIWKGHALWSPDGKTIAYVCRDFKIWLVSTKGGKPRKIIDYGRPYSWSPDGKWIFFYRGLKPHLFRVADERVFDIAPPDEVGNFFSWSSDGKKMLFYRPSYDYTVILKVVSASGGPSFQLGRELELWPYFHFWSPDSKMIITEGGDSEDTTFWMIPLAGGEALQLELDVSVVDKLQRRSMSPDCERLLFLVDQGDGTQDLYVVPISLEDARTNGPAVLVFSGWDSLSGLRLRTQWNISWSPDGRKLAVVNWGDIWITSAKEGKPVRITKTPEHEAWPVWSPNNEMIVYTVNTGEGEQILKVIPASGGEAKKILDTSDHSMYAWSPNSKELAVISKGMISAISIAGGNTRQILDLKHQGLVEDHTWGLCWSPDGKHLAFMSHKEMDEPTGIFMVAVEGGKFIELAADDHSWKDRFFWSPDGKWLSFYSDGFVKTRPEGTIWEVDVKKLLSKGKKEQKK